MSDLSSSSESPVLVIGNAGIDVIGRFQNQSQSGSSNPGHIRTSFGGVARNVAENLVRLDQPVTLLSVVGCDSAGDDLLDQLNNVGVDVSAVLQTDDYSTGTYLGIVNSKGELQLGIDDIRAISLLTPDYLRKNFDLFKRASLLFFDANLEKDTI